MAKKTRTPPPPRRPVQSPKQRPAQGGRATLSAGRRKQLLWGLGVLVVAIVVAIVVAVVATGGGSGSKSVAKTMIAAGCTYQEKAPLPPTKDENYHSDSPKLTSKVKWSTFPPSGGGHYPLWAVWGFYTEAANPRQVVHNEEHGGVIIWWGPQVPKSTVDELAAFYQSSPAGVFGTPIAGLGNKIALTAWTGDPSRYYRQHYYGIGHIATCSQFNEKAFAAFRDAYRGKGPEGVPLSSDQPGMGPSS